MTPFKVIQGTQAHEHYRRQTDDSWTGNSI